MKIQFNQNEIEEAICDYIAKKGFDISNREVEFDFTAGRGVSRITADVDIGDLEAVQSSGIPSHIGASPVVANVTPIIKRKPVVEEELVEVEDTAATAEVQPKEEEDVPPNEPQEEEVKPVSNSLFNK